MHHALEVAKTVMSERTENTPGQSVILGMMMEFLYLLQMSAPDLGVKTAVVL